MNYRLLMKERKRAGPRGTPPGYSFSTHARKVSGNGLIYVKMVGFAAATIATHLDRVNGGGLLAGDILVLVVSRIDFGMSHDAADQSSNRSGNEKRFLRFFHKFIGFGFLLFRARNENMVTANRLFAPLLDTSARDLFKYYSIFKKTVAVRWIELGSETDQRFCWGFGFLCTSVAPTGRDWHAPAAKADDRHNTPRSPIWTGHQKSVLRIGHSFSSTAKEKRIGQKGSQI